MLISQGHVAGRDGRNLTLVLALVLGNSDVGATIK